MTTTHALDRFGPDRGGFIAGIIEAATTGVAKVIDAVVRAKRHGISTGLILAALAFVGFALVVLVLPFL